MASSELEASGLPQSCYGSVNRIESLSDDFTEQPVTAAQLPPPETEVKMSSVLGYSGSCSRRSPSSQLLKQTSVDNSYTETSPLVDTVGHQERRLKTRKRATLVCLGLANVLSFMALSLMGPIYPIVAEEKGVNPTIYGWVFGIFSLTQCIMSPLFGKIIVRVGPKFMFIAGNFIAAGSCVLFGFLVLIDAPEGNATVFITMSFLIRIVQAVGNAAVGTAIFTLATNYFPENPAAIMGSLESVIGIGLMVGPTISGALYDASGFTLPFVLVGGIHFLLVPASYLVLLPDSSKSGDSSQEPVSMLAMLQVPGITVISVCLTGVAATWILLDPILEPHLEEQFSVSPTIVGLVFLCTSITYSVASPIIGYIADKVPDNIPIMILGYAIICLCMLLFGPSPITGLDEYQALWLNIVIMAVLGIAYSLAIIPTYNKLLAVAEIAGFPDNQSTTGTIGGIWWFFYAFGEFLGPTIGGWLFDDIGFAWCMTYVAAFNLIMAVILSSYWVYGSEFCKNKCRSRKSAYETL